MNFPQIIRKEEAASILGVSTFTLREWRMKGKLISGVHYVQYNSRNIRYFKEPLQQYLMEGTKPLIVTTVSNPE
jgi:predicted site-specific integrase-resolvase